MATSVYNIVEVELQDDENTVVQIRPLVITKVKVANARFADWSKNAADGAWDDLSAGEQSAKFTECLLDIVVLALQAKYKSLVKDRESLEDILDLPTMYKIVEAATGWVFNKDADADMGKDLKGLDGTS